MTKFIQIHENEFDTKVLQTSNPVIVEFGAEWCIPCKRIEPILEELAQEWDGNVQLIKIDVDSNVNLTMRYNVMGVPTIILFKNGSPLVRLTGAQNRKKLHTKLGQHI
jgi:thioredoxin 1